jgi:hypothetical protein
MITYIKFAEFLCEMKSGKRYRRIGQVGERETENVLEERDVSVGGRWKWLGLI